MKARMVSYGFICSIPLLNVIKLKSYSDLFLEWIGSLDKSNCKYFIFKYQKKQTFFKWKNVQKFFPYCILSWTLEIKPGIKGVKFIVLALNDVHAYIT